MDDMRLSTDFSVPPAPQFHMHTITLEKETMEKRLVNTLAMDGNPLVRYIRIQQCIVHPQLYYDSIASKTIWNGDASKWESFRTILHSSDEPTIVFCQFRKEMDMVQREARIHKHKDKETMVFRISGGRGKGNNNHATVSLAREAVAAGKHVVVVIQIATGGCGINMQFCTRIMFLSKHWNPAIVHQAVGRAVRIGQTQQVHVHMWNVQDGGEEIDTHIEETHRQKILAAQTMCKSLYAGFGLTSGA
jgi:SNF2 family DNA or RNA helicase